MTPRPDCPPSAPPWHAQPAEQALAALDSRPQGLTAAQAAQRLAQH